MIRSHARGWVSVALLATASALALSSCGDDTPSRADAKGLDTLDAGVIKVAVQPYAPYTSVENGKLTGLDSDILQKAADNLGLKVEPQLTDFNGMLGGVQSHRVDISIGGIAWSKERQEEGLFTDPAYYSPPAMAVHGGGDLRDRPGPRGQGPRHRHRLRVGEVDQGDPWRAKLHAYPDANGVFNDLNSGRIDVGFLDPLIIIDALEKRPDFDFETQYLTPPTADEIAASPDLAYLAPYQVAFYVAKEAPKLEAAISEEIDKMYANGELQELIEEYGGEPDQFLVPTPEMSTSRQGVDRPDDWAAPGTTS